MFNLQSPSKFSPLDAVHLLRRFPLLRTVFDLINVDVLVLLPFYVSPLPHQQNASLGGIFSSRETNKKLLRVRSHE